MSSSWKTPRTSNRPIYPASKPNGCGSSAWRNEITCNPWIWAALALCTALLAVPPYVPLLAGTLMLAPIGLQAWSVVAAMSLAPLVLLQALEQGSRRPRAGGGEAGRGTDMLA